jgi:hypothetical protein
MAKKIFRIRHLQKNNMQRGNDASFLFFKEFQAIPLGNNNQQGGSV